MSKLDALRKVRGLLATANAPSASDGERANASELAIKLRLKHGISDRDLAIPEEDIELLGRPIFYYSNFVKPHLDNIKDEIEAVYALLDGESPRNDVNTIDRFYSDVRLIVEGNSYKDGIRQKRNAMIKKLYEQARDEQLKEEPDIDPTFLHRHARFAVEMAVSDMRKDTIERIVGVSEAKLWEEAARRVQEEAGE